jgi:hypothetical protein
MEHEDSLLSAQLALAKYNANNSIYSAGSLWSRKAGLMSSAQNSLSYIFDHSKLWLWLGGSLSSVPCAFYFQVKWFFKVNEGVREKENSDRLEWLQRCVQCEGLEEELVFNSLTNSLGPRKFLHFGVLYKVWLSIVWQPNMYSNVDFNDRLPNWVSLLISFSLNLL